MTAPYYRDYRVFRRCSTQYKCVFVAVSIILFLLIWLVQKHYNIVTNKYTIFVPISVFCLLFGLPTLINVYIVLFKPYRKMLKTLKNSKIIQFICSDFFFQELEQDLKYEKWRNKKKNL